MPPDTLLTFRNIRCIPSVHSRARYAAEAERTFHDWRPDAVAVEVLGLAETPYLEAVRALPRIQAVCLEPAGQEASEEPVQVLGMTSIDPADSIVAASRCALAAGVPVACVDAYVENDDTRPECPALADELLLDRLGLEAYYARYLEQVAPTDPPTRASLLREQAMAQALQELSRRHERVLFVTGMFHWERIKGFISHPPPAASREAAPAPPPRAYRIDVTAEALAVVLGQLPFLVGTYERHRRRGLWDRASGQAALAGLLVETFRRAGLAPTPARLARLASLACRVTSSQHRLTPRLVDLMLAARGIGGRELARHLLHTAGAYRQPPPGDERPVAICVKGYQGPLVRVKNRICLPTAGDQLERSGAAASELLRDLGAEEDFKSTEHPPYVDFITCRDENEREDRIARQIAERMESPGRRGAPSREFLSGLGSGLDCRRTARDLATLGRTFVRQGRRAGFVDRFGGLIVDFRREEAEPLGTSICKDCTHAGPKYWKLGYAGPAAAQPGHEWPFAAYGLLAVIFETTRAPGTVQSLWWEEVSGQEKGLEPVARAVFRHAPRGRPFVALIAPEPPSETLRRLARGAGRTLLWRRPEAVADLLQQIKGFHRVVATGHPNAE